MVLTTQKSVFKWFKQNTGWHKSLWIKSAINFLINPCIRQKRNSLVRHKLFHEDLSNTHTKHLLEHFCLCFCKPVHSYGFSPDTSKTRPFEVQHSKCPALKVSVLGSPLHITFCNLFKVLNQRSLCLYNFFIGCAILTRKKQGHRTVTKK